MVAETKRALSRDSLESLQDLVQVNIDSFRLLAEAADRIQDPILGNLLRSLSAERWEQIEELKRAVKANGEMPTETGSFRASAHREWMKFRATFSLDNSESILGETLRAERYLKKQYEQALTSHPGGAMSDVLHRQYARIKAACRRVAELTVEECSTASTSPW